MAEGLGRVTVTLPSPGRMLLALALIAAVFVVALAIGRAHRPPALNVEPPLPQAARTTAAQSPAVTVPAAAPPLPALKVIKPRSVILRRRLVPTI